MVFTKQQQGPKRSDPETWEEAVNGNARRGPRPKRVRQVYKQVLPCNTVSTFPLAPFILEKEERSSGRCLRPVTGSGQQRQSSQRPHL